jgi:hypothetical protein
VEKDEALAVDIVSAVNAGGEVAITQKACEPCQGFLI